MLQKNNLQTKKKKKLGASHCCFICQRKKKKSSKTSGGWPAHALFTEKNSWFSLHLATLQELDVSKAKLDKNVSAEAGETQHE